MEQIKEPELLAIRQFLYSFFGSSFLHYLSAEAITIILQERLFDEFPLEIDGEDFQQGLNLLQAWAKENRNAVIQDVLDELRLDYNALFVGPGHLLAAPWESVYLTEEKTIFGEPMMAVREFYLSHGWELARKNTEPDDHFGVEMEFMARMIAKQGQALAEGEQEEADFLAREQLRFLQEHLLKWLNEFTSGVLKNARTPFFQGLSRLVRGVIAWDYDYLETAAGKS